MAESLKPRRKRASKNGASNDDAGTASNVFKLDRKEVKDFFERLDGLHDDKETKNAEFMSDIKELFREAAEGLGVSTTAVREVYQEHRQALKRQLRRKEMDGDKVDEIDKLKAALGSYASTPLGKVAIEAAQLAQE